LRRDDSLRRFLADLLQNLVQALLEEVRRVRPLRHLATPVGDDAVNLSEHGPDLFINLYRLSSEARARARVAGGAARLHEHDERVRVAVEPHVHDALRVPGSRTLVPEFRARARPEPGLAFAERAAQALLVHVCE